MANLNDYLSAQRGRSSQVARRAGIAKGTLSGIRSGARKPSPEMAKRIEQATGGAVSAASMLGLTGNHEAPPRNLGDGRWIVAPDSSGTFHLPQEMVDSMGFEEGERLMFQVRDGKVEVTSAARNLKRIQDEISRLAPAARPMSEELIAERRAEAGRDTDG